MGQQQFTNNASALLAGTISNTATSLQVATGFGAEFPSLSGSETFTISVQDNSGDIEYMKVTAVSGDVFTVVRGFEGSTAIGFTANLARVELRDTAGTLAGMYQKSGDTMSGPVNLGGQTVTNGVLSSGISIESAEEIVNTPIRGATGITTNQITVPADGSRAQAGGLNILCAGDALPVYAVGMIMMWNSAIENIPAGWNICDGTNGTPDLTDSFIVAAGNSYTLDETGSITLNTSAVSAGTPTLNPVTLSVANLPAHEHPFDYFAGNTLNNIVVPGGSAGAGYFEALTGSGVRNSFAGTPTGSGTEFTPTAAAMGTHQHTVAVGPYYALYFIMYIG